MLVSDGRYYSAMYRCVYWKLYELQKNCIWKKNFFFFFLDTWADDLSGEPGKLCFSSSPTLLKTINDHVFAFILKTRLQYRINKNFSNKVHLDVNIFIILRQTRIVIGIISVRDNNICYWNELHKTNADIFLSSKQTEWRSESEYYG